MQREATNNKLSQDVNNKHFYSVLFSVGLISLALSNFGLSTTERLSVGYTGAHGPRGKTAFFWTYI